MNKQLGAIAIAVVAVAAAAGLLASASSSAGFHLGPLVIRNAFLTGMKDGKPGLRFTLDGGGTNNTPTFISFDVRLARGDGLRFNRKKVMKGTACHGPAKWKSSWISTKKMRCTPQVPLPLADTLTAIGISGMHESLSLEQEVKEQKVAKLLFYATVEDSNHNLFPVRGVGTIKN